MTIITWNLKTDPALFSASLSARLDQANAQQIQTLQPYSDHPQAAQCRAVLNQDSTVTDVRLDLEVYTATKNC